MSDGSVTFVYPDEQLECKASSEDAPPPPVTLWEQYAELTKGTHYDSQAQAQLGTLETSSWSGMVSTPRMEKRYVTEGVISVQTSPMGETVFSEWTPVMVRPDAAIRDDSTPTVVDDAQESESATLQNESDTNTQQERQQQPPQYFKKTVTMTVEHNINLPGYTKQTIELTKPLSPDLGLLDEPLPAGKRSRKVPRPSQRPIEYDSSSESAQNTESEIDEIMYLYRFTGPHTSRSDSMGMAAYFDESSETDLPASSGSSSSSSSSSSSRKGGSSSPSTSSSVTSDSEVDQEPAYYSYSETPPTSASTADEDWSYHSDKQVVDVCDDGEMVVYDVDEEERVDFYDSLRGQIHHLRVCEAIIEEEEEEEENEEETDASADSTVNRGYQFLEEEERRDLATSQQTVRSEKQINIGYFSPRSTTEMSLDSGLCTETDVRLDSEVSSLHSECYVEVSGSEMGSLKESRCSSLPERPMLPITEQSVIKLRTAEEIRQRRLPLLFYQETHIDFKLPMKRKLKRPRSASGRLQGFGPLKTVSLVTSHPRRPTWRTLSCYSLDDSEDEDLFPEYLKKAHSFEEFAYQMDSVPLGRMTWSLSEPDIRDGMAKESHLVPFGPLERTQSASLSNPDLIPFAPLERPQKAALSDSEESYHTQVSVPDGIEQWMEDLSHSSGDQYSSVEQLKPPSLQDIWDEDLVNSASEDSDAIVVNYPVGTPIVWSESAVTIGQSVPAIDQEPSTEQRKRPKAAASAVESQRHSQSDVVGRYRQALEVLEHTAAVMLEHNGQYRDDNKDVDAGDQQQIEAEYDVIVEDSDDEQDKADDSIGVVAHAGIEEQGDDLSVEDRTGSSESDQKNELDVQDHDNYSTCWCHDEREPNLPAADRSWVDGTSVLVYQPEPDLSTSPGMSGISLHQTMVVDVSEADDNSQKALQSPRQPKKYSERIFVRDPEQCKEMEHTERERGHSSGDETSDQGPRKSVLSLPLIVQHEFEPSTVQTENRMHSPDGGTMVGENNQDSAEMETRFGDDFTIYGFTSSRSSDISNPSPDSVLSRDIEFDSNRSHPGDGIRSVTDLSDPAEAYGDFNKSREGSEVPSKSIPRTKSEGSLSSADSFTRVVEVAADDTVISVTYGNSEEWIVLDKVCMAPTDNCVQPRGDTDTPQKGKEERCETILTDYATQPLRGTDMLRLDKVCEPPSDSPIEPFRGKDSKDSPSIATAEIPICNEISDTTKVKTSRETQKRPYPWNDEPDPNADYLVIQGAHAGDTQGEDWRGVVVKTESPEKREAWASDWYTVNDDVNNKEISSREEEMDRLASALNNNGSAPLQAMPTYTNTEENTSVVEEQACEKVHVSVKPPMDETDAPISQAEVGTPCGGRNCGIRAGTGEENNHELKHGSLVSAESSTRQEIFPEVSMGDNTSTAADALFTINELSSHTTPEPGNMVDLVTAVKNDSNGAVHVLQEPFTKPDEFGEWILYKEFPTSDNSYLGLTYSQLTELDLLADGLSCNVIEAVYDIIETTYDVEKDIEQQSTDVLRVFAEAVVDSVIDKALQQLQMDLGRAQLELSELKVMSQHVPQQEMSAHKLCETSHTLKIMGAENSPTSMCQSAMDPCTTISRAADLQTECPTDPEPNGVEFLGSDTYVENSVQTACHGVQRVMNTNDMARLSNDIPVVAVGNQHRQSNWLHFDLPCSPQDERPYWHTVELSPRDESENWKTGGEL